MNSQMKIMFGVSAAILIAAFVIAYINFGMLETLLVVHFDAYQGIDFLGTTGDVFGLIVSGTALALINSLLAWVFYKRDPFFAHIFAGITVFVSLLILIAIIGIISIN